MKKWKKVIISISALAVAIIACIISALYGFREGVRAGGFSVGALGSSMPLAEIWVAGQHMSDQMTAANCEGVKISIKEHLTVIEKYKNIKNIIFTEKTYFADKMLDHLRLSQIEDKMGDEKENVKQLALAKEACNHSGYFKSCSDESLILIAKRFQKKNPIACLADDK